MARKPSSKIRKLGTGAFDTRVPTSKPTVEPERIQGDVPTDSLAFGLSPLGTSGLKESGGWIYEEFLPALAGQNGVRLYGEMEKNSATIGAVRKLVRDLTRQVEWSVVPNKESKDPIKAKRAAEFVDGCRTDMEHTWSDLISEALTMVEYGFAPCEITYKLRRGKGQPPEFNSKFKDGMIGWRSIELRSQDTLDRWEFEGGTRKLLGMWQSDFYGGANQNVFIPRERFVNFRTESTKNNPEGRPLFRNAVVPYMRVKHLETLEMIGADRDLTGLPVMEVPLKILAANNQDPVAASIRATLEKQLGSLKRHEREFLLMPTSELPDGSKSGYSFRLEKAAGARQLDIVGIKNSFKTDIFQSCLAQFLQLGQGGNGGARAQSAGEIDLFSLALYAILEAITQAFQRECIDRLCVLNNIDPDDVPCLEFGEVQVPNLQAIGQYLTSLNQAGILVPDEELAKHLYKIAGLPYVTADEKVVTADQLINEAFGDGELSIGDGGSGGVDTAAAADVELLNGAQLSALVQVVESMAAGTLPKASASTILVATLGLEPKNVAGILDPVEEKLLTTGPTAPAMPYGGGPSRPGGAQGAAPVQPSQLGDPATVGDMPGGVKSADQLVNEVLKHVLRKGYVSVDVWTRFEIQRAAAKGAQ